MKQYEVLEKANAAGFQIIRIIDGVYAGIEYAYNRVSFEEEAEGPMCSFDYDVYVDVEKLAENDKAAFGQFIANILFEIMQEQLARNEVVYAGGTNE